MRERIVSNLFFYAQSTRTLIYQGRDEGNDMKSLMGVRKGKRTVRIQGGLCFL